MDRKRLRQVRSRAREAFGRIETPEQLDFVEALLGDGDRSGEAPLALLLRRFEGADRLLGLVRELNAERSLGQLLVRIVDAAVELSGAERGVLILGSAPPFSQEVARRFGAEDLDGQALQFSRTIAERVVATDRVFTLDDALADGELGQLPSVQQMRLRSILAVPLRGREAILGLLYVDNRFAEGIFDGENARVLQALADQAAVAIETTRLGEALTRAHDAQAHQLRRAEGLLEVQQAQLVEQSAGFRSLLGRSPGMKAVFAQIVKIAPTDIPILIQGESGTGKELVARAIHDESARAGKPFVSENCAAISENLIESELFGHAAGAFTGAREARPGLFALADGGTLFLDEVADMSGGLQTKLLRALQEGVIRPVGAKAPVAVDVRVISAANRSLRQLVASGPFREDLYYRLAGVTLQLPPLRERREDIPLLLQQFLAQQAEALGEPRRPVDRRVLDILLAYDWPGNIRELRNEVQAMIALSDGTILPQHLSERLRGEGAVAPVEALESLDAAVEAVERRLLERAMKGTRNKTEASELLGISRYTLNRKLEKYGLEA